jgi:hypothetical protein
VTGPDAKEDTITPSQPPPRGLLVTTEPIDYKRLAKANSVSFTAELYIDPNSQDRRLNLVWRAVEPGVSGPIVGVTFTKCTAL